MCPMDSLSGFLNYFSSSPLVHITTGDLVMKCLNYLGCENALDGHMAVSVHGDRSISPYLAENL